MSYHYGANYGLVIPLNETTAEKMGILDEFHLVRDSDEGLATLQDWYSNRSKDVMVELPVDPVLVAVAAIVTTIDRLLGFQTDLLFSGDVIEPGEEISDDTYFLLFSFQELYEMTPKPVLRKLREMGLEPTEDAWVTGG
jgi:hypothetical protein